MTSTTNGRLRHAATVAFFISLIASAPAAMAATINIAWDANAPAENVVGYKVYVGTQSGVYGSPVDVGNVTTYAFTSAVAGQPYFFAVAAYNASGGNSPLSGEVSGSTAVTDTTVPLVSITSPTSASTYSTSASTISISGTASDNVGVTQVTYTVNGGVSVAASGTTSWSVASVALQIGSNTIVVTARDAVGNTATDTLTVTRTDATAPTISITSPTSASTYSTPVSTIALGGTASDNVGVTQVSYTVNGGASMVATGTASWSVASIALVSGSNTIVVTARDAVGNTATDTLTVTRTDGTAPSITITSPTSASSFSTTASSIDIGGSSSDDVGVTQVTWATNTGLSGTASGTTSWSVSGITLQSGSNIITVTSRDAAGNIGTDTLTVTATMTGTVSAVSVSPSSGNGSSQTFAFQFSDTAGGANITQAWVWFNATFASTAANSCLFYYDRPSGRINLIDDAGQLWQPAVLGTSGSLQNSSCAIGLAGSSVTFSGTTMTMNVALTFTSSFAGTKNVYMYGANGGGSNSAWQTLGSWTVPAGAAAVTADSSMPNAGSGASQTFALRYSDTTGAGNLASAWVWINASFAASAANSCMAYWDKTTNQINLINDSGTAWISMPLGGGGSLQNSSCTIAMGSTSVSTSGNTLTLNLALTFAPGYAGTKNIYMYGADASLNSGWQTRGAWTVTSSAPVTADSVTPNAGSGSTQAFAFRFSDTGGGVNLTQTWVWFNATFASSAANSCMVYHDKATNQVYLINDAGTAWLPGTLGTSATLQNTSCVIALASSSISISGNTLTLTLATTFKPAFTGTKNIYMYVADGSQDSGWQTRGTWTVP